MAGLVVGNKRLSKPDKKVLRQERGMTDRVEGRVVLADPEDRILLIRAEDPSIDTPSLWVTPGGGCERDESPDQAARRELFEEAGLVDRSLSPCVWRRCHTWRWGERQIRSLSHFFFCRIPDRSLVTRTNNSDLEMLILKEFRWWSADELIAAGNEVFSPRRIAEFLPDLLQGNFPTTPIDVGC